MFTLILFTRPQFGFSPLTFIEDGAKRTRELMLYYRMLYGNGYLIVFQAVADAQKYVFPLSSRPHTRTLTLQASFHLHTSPFNIGKFDGQASLTGSD